jgi:hypothetical protein
MLKTTEGHLLKTVLFDQLESSDLHVDACYEGGRVGNAGDDPLPRLLRVDSQGGFRKRGKVAGKLDMLVLTSSMNDPDWPDSLDRETGIFTYYGDNKKPGRELHETGRHGNLILQRIFTGARSGPGGSTSSDAPHTLIGAWSTSAGWGTAPIAICHVSHRHQSRFLDSRISGQSCHGVASGNN